MVDGRGTLELLRALGERPGAARLEALLKRPGPDRMFPAIGVPRAEGIRYPRALANPGIQPGLGETGRGVVAYLTDLIGHRPEVERLCQELTDQETDLLRAAWRRTRSYLPAGTALGPVRLVLLPIGFDFRTDRETVYIDPLAALALGAAGIRDTLSHELHHIARYRITGTNLTLMRPDRERPPRSRSSLLSEWAAWLEAEGIADCVHNMIDTTVTLFRDAAALRRTQMADYERLLERAVGLARAVGDGPRAAVELRLALRQELRGLAHPIGARMAGSIREALGVARLVGAVGRPREFLEAYNEAARSLGRREFDGALLPPLAHPRAAGSAPKDPHRGPRRV